MNSFRHFRHKMACRSPVTLYPLIEVNYYYATNTIDEAEEKKKNRVAQAMDFKSARSLWINILRQIKRQKKKPN